MHIIQKDKVFRTRAKGEHLDKSSPWIINKNCTLKPFFTLEKIVCANRSTERRQCMTSRVKCLIDLSRPPNGLVSLLISQLRKFEAVIIA